jgi:hypothetical protein
MKTPLAPIPSPTPSTLEPDHPHQTPFKARGFLKPSVLELLYRVFYTLTHGQKHSILSCYHDNIILNFFICLQYLFQYLLLIDLNRM